MQVNDIMSRNVVTAEPTMPLSLAVTSLIGNKISGLPVIDAKMKPVGILTEGDLLRRIEIATERTGGRWLDMLWGQGNNALAFIRSRSRTVGDVMTTPVQTIDEHAPLDEAIARMEKSRIKRLPVVRNERLVGIISRSDFIRALGVKLLLAEPADMADAAILARIEDVLIDQPWFDTTEVTIDVRQGVAILEGRINDPRTRLAIKVAAECVAGVRAVDDRLRPSEPMTIFGTS